MTQPELALQKLNELRAVVDEDGDVAELVDTLATLMVLKQDMSEPMFGAKVTLWTEPVGEWVEIDYAEYREAAPFDLPDDPEEAYQRRTDGSIDFYDEEPWWLRWSRHDDRHKEVDEGEYRHDFRRYLAWTEQEELDREDVPEEILAGDGVGEMQDIAGEREREEWLIYGVASSGPTFERKRLVPTDELRGRRAIVVEPHIAEQPTGTDYWDPNRGEYTTPEDYPMGTVNVVVPDDPDDEFGEDYTYEMAVETSVVPADGEPEPHSYTPGWG